MSSVFQRRISKELAEFTTPPEGISASMRGSDMREWEAHIAGPSDTPYAGGIFELRINLPAEYPFSAPVVKFITPIMHANVSSSGNICLDTLNSKWTPALTIAKVLLSIQLLMSCPNSSSALNVEAAQLYRRSHAEFARRAREHTLKHAIPK
jgi:ubiquitin-conjugating enzyme E2 D/E